jgi:hypothetical protein
MPLVSILPDIGRVDRYHINPTGSDEYHSGMPESLPPCRSAAPCENVLG